jgi:hypothetical protein
MSTDRWMLRLAALMGTLVLLALAACGSTAMSATRATRATRATGATRATRAARATDATGATGATSSPVPASAAVPTTTAPAVATSIPHGTGLQVGPGALVDYTVQPQPGPGSCHYSWVGPYPLPDPICTPGAVDPQVTQDNLSSTICRIGWTATVRPPESVTGPEKVASAAAYDYTGPWDTAEYDHLVPLDLGGDPNDPANLWVEPNDRPGATTFTNSKDTLEITLNQLVCSGQLTLAAAQEAIASDWVTAYQRYDA